MSILVHPANLKETTFLCEGGGFTENVGPWSWGAHLDPNLYHHTIIGVLSWFVCSASTRPFTDLRTQFRPDLSRNDYRAGGRGHKDCCIYCMIGTLAYK